MGLIRVFFMAVIFAVFFYVCHQLLRFTDLSLLANLGVIGFLGLVFSLFLSLPLLAWSEDRHNHKPWHDSLFAAGHFAIGYLNFLLTLVILRDLLAFIINFAWSSAPEWLNLDSLYGANVLGLFLVIPFLLIIIGTIVVRVGPQLKSVTLKFDELPQAWDGTKILHITDLHISSSMPVSFVEKLVTVAAKVKADAIVYTGDILDSLAIRHLSEFELLKSLQAPLGSFYVPGNHEYYWQVDQALAAFRSIGFKTLINETATLEKDHQRLQISGIPDPAARAFNLEAPDFRKFSLQLLPGSFRILLAHQPSYADEASKSGFHLQLSGHTHGGQFFPWNFLIGFFQKYAKGLYQIDKLKLYVNQGTGYWGPSLRMGTYCEITEIILKKT